MMVFLRGTSGCGKSTVARHFLDNYLLMNTYESSARKIEAYRVRLPSGKPLTVLGRYETACGGLDGVKSFELILELVAKHYREGEHMLFERLTGSDVAWGTLGPGLAEYRCRHAFMDTPIELCIERVKRRRQEAGNFKPLNENNTRQRTRAIWRAYDRLALEFLQPVLLVDHRRPEKQLLELFGEFHPIRRRE